MRPETVRFPILLGRMIWKPYEFIGIPMKGPISYKKEDLDLWVVVSSLCVGAPRGAACLRGEVSARSQRFEQLRGSGVIPLAQVCEHC